MSGKTVLVKKKENRNKNQTTLLVAKKVDNNQTENLKPAVKPGPKCDERGNILEYSILGTIHDYIQYRKSLEPSTPQQVNEDFRMDVTASNKSLALEQYRSKVEATKSIDLLLSKSLKSREEEQMKRSKRNNHIPYYIATADTKEEKALKKYLYMKKEWEKYNEKVSKRIGRDPRDTVFSKTDEFREKKEELALIEEKLPQKMNPESQGYWEQSLRGLGTRYVTIGNALTGLCTEIKSGTTEVKEHIRLGKPLNHAWMKSSKYLAKKLKQLDKKMMKTTGYVPPPDIGADMIVQGRDLWEWVKTSHEESIQKVQNTIEFIEHTERRRSSMITPLHRAIVQDGNNENRNKTDGPYYDMIPLPHKVEGEFDPYILEYLNKNTNEPVSDVNTPLEVLFDTFINKPIQRDVRVMNSGKTVIYYNWVKEEYSSKIDVGGVRATKSKMMKFYCNNIRGSILPGEYRDFTFTFQSTQAGVFREQWKFNTKPEVQSCHNLLLRGAAISLEENLFAKQQIIEEIDQNVYFRNFYELSKSIVELVHTPPPEFTPEQIEQQRKDQFEKENPTLYYSSDIYHNLEDIVNQCFDLLDFPPQDRIWNLSVSMVEDLVSHITTPPEIPEPPPPQPKAEGEEEGEDNPEDEEDENGEKKKKKPPTPPPVHIEYTPLQQLQKNFQDKIKELKEEYSIRPTVYSHYYPIVQQLIYDIIDEVPVCSYKAERYVGFQFRDWVPPIIPHDYSTGFKPHPPPDQPLIPMEETVYNENMNELIEMYKEFNGHDIPEPPPLPPEEEEEKKNNGEEEGEGNGEERAEEENNDNNNEEEQQHEDGENNENGGEGEEEENNKENEEPQLDENGNPIPVEPKAETTEEEEQNPPEPEWKCPELPEPKYEPTVEYYRSILYSYIYKLVSDTMNKIEDITFMCDNENTIKMVEDTNMLLGYKQKIKDIDFKDKKVIIRANLDVHFAKGKGDALVFPPIEQKRMDTLIAEINDIIGKGAQYVMIISNYRNPKGEVEKDLSFTPLSKFLKKSFKNLVFVEDIVGPKAEKAFAKISTGTVFLIENIYFQKFEEGKVWDGPLLRSMLPHIPDIYIPEPEMEISEEVRNAYRDANDDKKKKKGGAADKRRPSSKSLSKRKSSTGAIPPAEESEPVIVTEQQQQYLEKEKYINTLDNLCDIYINDCFDLLDKTDISIVKIGNNKERICGTDVEYHIQQIRELLERPIRPLITIVGGIPTPQRLAFIYNMIPKSDAVVVSGVLGLSFLSCMYNVNVGMKSWNDNILKPHIRALVAYAERFNVKMYYPIDCVCGDAPITGEDYEGETLEIPFIYDNINTDLDLSEVAFSEVPSGYTCYDEGPKTQQRNGALLPEMKTVVWCGCVGKVEAEMFRSGTKALADNIASNSDLKSYIFGSKCVNYALDSSDYDSYTYLCSNKIGEKLISLTVVPGICLLNNKEEFDPLPKIRKEGEEEEEEEENEEGDN